MRGRLAGTLCAAILLAPACASLEAPGVRSAPGDLPASVELEQVPFHPQEAHHCGPAALATALGWSGASVDATALAATVYTPGREGSLQHDLVTAARRRGRLAYPVGRLRDVLAELASGSPVVVLQNLGLSFPLFERWHYAVVVGYDLERGTVTLRSGRRRRAIVGMNLFERTWARGERWAIVVLAAGTIPATAEERGYVDATIGLERAGQAGAAAVAYSAGLTRWPRSLGATVGLGNARYATGDPAGAARAFRAAVRWHPTSAAAHNNLAHVLAELGERDAALRAARRAVELGGPDADAYARTLQAIEEDR